MDYLELFRRHDHPTRCESPPGFDYAAASSRFATFAKELSAKLVLNLRTETGSDIQDASFHSQIYLPTSNDWHALLRFSNFGEMATVTEDEPAPPATLAAVIELLAKHGYVYIPVEMLHRPYDGKNLGVTGIDSWWIRYFDWV